MLYTNFGKEDYESEEREQATARNAEQFRT
jgi:hypothetical protein